MADAQWNVVDNYLGGLLAPPDDALSATLAANARAGLPAIDVSPVLGKFLHVLTLAISAKKVLEVGTLGGYSTIWLARALPAGGRVVTLESDPTHAAVARTNFDRAGVSKMIDILVGDAHHTLPQLIAENRGPFDLIFLDADKPSNAEYLQWSLRLSRPGTLIVCDNVVRDGAVADPASSDPSVQGIRRFLDVLATEPRVNATAIQTVGVKGYDGFAIGVVRE